MGAGLELMRGAGLELMWGVGLEGASIWVGGLDGGGLPLNWGGASVNIKGVGWGAELECGWWGLN